MPPSTTTAEPADSAYFANSTVLVTRPGAAPALQWIVDTGLHGPELTSFHQQALGGVGALVEHQPARGTRRGFTEVRVAVTDVPSDLIAQLPGRLRAALATAAW